MNGLLANRNGLNEIVFEGRNKAYGAYALRTSYDANLNKAIAITSSLILVLFASSFISSLNRDKPFVEPIKNDEPYEISNLELIVELKPPPAAPTVRLQEQSTHTNGSFRTTPDELITSKPVTTTTITNTRGTTSTTITSMRNFGGIRGLDSGMVAIRTFLEPKQIISERVEQMPEFPGGSEMMVRFLQENIRRNPSGIDREGTVMVDFVVEPDGEVGQVMISRSLGSGYDEEALRVVEMMPRWTPGRQNGNAVPVRLHLPITFTLN